MSSPTPGWNPDPSGRHEYRYWDGSNWTDDVADGGVTSTDPLAADGGYPNDAAPTSGGEPTQAYGPDPASPAGPGQPGYDQPGYQQPSYQQPGDPSGGYGASGAGAGAGGPGEPGAPGGYDPYGTGAQYGSGSPYGTDPYGTGGGLPPATPQKSTPVGLLIGLAVAAVVIIVVAAIVLLGGGDDDDDPTAGSTTTTEEDETTTTEDEPEETTTTVPGPETQGVFALAVGDCVTDSSLEGEVSEVSIVDCSQPHTSEVFHSYEMTDAALPDQAGIETTVRDQCLPAFESFVGLPSSSSTLAVSYLSPTPESWDSGDRELLCLVADPAGQTTGSLAGANR